MTTYADLDEPVLRLLDSLRHAAIAPFVADWPRTHERRAMRPAALPVLRWLPDMTRDAPAFSAELVSAVHDAAPSLRWRQTYTARDLGAQFIENYAWCELVGPNGPLASERIACGLLLLGPSTLYPRHRHEADEIYLPLYGAALWQQGDAQWRARAPGTLIHHAAEEPHAMRTAADPLLALYLWRGSDLTQKARLDPARPS
jgi:hypothetical protein